MKKFIVPLITVMVVSIILAGCVPGAAPAPPTAAPPTAPEVPAEYQELIDEGLVDPNLVLNPYEGLAIKPDGTPYVFRGTYILLSLDWMLNVERLATSLLTRAGADFSTFDANMDAQAQIGYLEDLRALTPPDALLIHPVHEDLLVPAVEAMVEAGIPVFDEDVPTHTDKVTCWAYHRQLPPVGQNLMGEWFVQKAEERGEMIYIYEIWGTRAMEISRDRNQAFHEVVDECPLITVMESPDSQWSNEITADLVLAAFPAHPELNAIYHHGGGEDGAISALKTLGLLKPIDDPDHIILASGNCGTEIVEAIKRGEADAFTTHEPWDLADIIVKAMLTNVVLGQPVPHEIISPMRVVSADNLYTAKRFGATAVYPLMPKKQWDLWPVLDTSTGLLDANFNPIGLATPTK